MYLEEQLHKLLCLIIRFYSTSEEGEGRKEVVVSFILRDCFYTITEEGYLYQRGRKGFSWNAFSLPKTLSSEKGSCACGYLKASFLLVKFYRSVERLFLRLPLTADVPCSKRKSILQPSPPTKIIILFIEAQFCFPKLQVMVKKPKATLKNSEKRRGEEYFPMLQGTRNSLPHQKSHF